MNDRLKYRFHEIIMRIGVKKGPSTRKKILLRIGESCEVSQESVKNWRYAKHGTSVRGTDLSSDRLQKIADILNEYQDGEYLTPENLKIHLVKV